MGGPKGGGGGGLGGVRPPPRDAESSSKTLQTAQLGVLQTGRKQNPRANAPTLRKGAAELERRVVTER